MLQAISVKALPKVNVPDTELMFFGAGRPQNAPDFGFTSHYIGVVHDDITLRVLYSAADVMVVPSIQEALVQTAIEAMACGTPVVAFGATGLLDIVDHQINGYLATPFEPGCLAQGIEWVLSHPQPEVLRSNARQKVMEKFEAGLVARQYVALYKEILNNKK